MTIKKNTWIVLVLLVLLSLAFWTQFTLPRFSFIDIPINRQKALKIAEEYMTKERGVDVNAYRHATVFITLEGADHFLQRALGNRGEWKFIRKHDYDLFLWIVRFFKENEQEEYRLSVSASSGQICGFRHAIASTDRREYIDEEKAKEKAVAFLTEKFDFDLDDFEFQGRLQTQMDNRTEYKFSWKKKDAHVPWSNESDKGEAKLLMGATISGDEILVFSKYNLEIPEKFSLEETKRFTINRFISIICYTAYFSLIAGAIFFVILRRNHLPMHVVKRFIIWLAAAIFIWITLDDFNQFEHILFNYPTTISLKSHLSLYVVNLLIASFKASLLILMPGLSGESLQHEQFPDKREGGFRHYLMSTFLSRHVSQVILLGYLTAIIMLGIQSLSFYFGQKLCGVWMEHRYLTQITTNYFPFLATFVMGFQAGIFEEILFRIFAISWLKKLTQNTILSVILASALWGLGHSNYEIFPMWFRAVEIFFLGLFLSSIYLRFGIIPVVVGHYLFDVFWGATSFIFGRVSTFDFYTSLGILLLPLGWAVVAFVINRPDIETPMRWRLNKHQLFNLEVLKTYLKTNPVYITKPSEEVRKELATHGWDMGVVEAALESQSQTQNKN